VLVYWFCTQVCSKLEQELAAKQENLDLLHTSVLVAEEARAAAVRQLSTARAQEDREVQAYEAELKELQACLGADRELLQVRLPLHGLFPDPGV